MQHMHGLGKAGSYFTVAYIDVGAVPQIRARAFSQRLAQIKTYHVGLRIIKHSDIANLRVIPLPY